MRGPSSRVPFPALRTKSHRPLFLGRSHRSHQPSQKPRKDQRQSELRTALPSPVHKTQTPVPHLLTKQLPTAFSKAPSESPTPCPQSTEPVTETSCCHPRAREWAWEWAGKAESHLHL